MDEFAIRCSCRIRKSVKILLWIQNPGKNIFKICQSICLFTSLHEGLARTWVGVCALLAFISWLIVHDNSWSTFLVHVVGELKCGSQSTAPTCCVELALKGVTLALKGLWDTSFPRGQVRFLGDFGVLVYPPSGVARQSPCTPALLSIVMSSGHCTDHCTTRSVAGGAWKKTKQNKKRVFPVCWPDSYAMIMSPNKGRTVVHSCAHVWGTGQAVVWCVCPLLQDCTIFTVIFAYAIEFISIYFSIIFKLL